MSAEQLPSTHRSTSPTKARSQSSAGNPGGRSDALHAPLDGAYLLTPEEVAQALRQSRTRIYELMASRELRSVKLGRSRRVSMQALREYVRELEGR